MTWLMVNIANLYSPKEETFFHPYTIYWSFPGVVVTLLCVFFILKKAPKAIGWADKYLMNGLLIVVGAAAGFALGPIGALPILLAYAVNKDELARVKKAEEEGR